MSNRFNLYFNKLIKKGKMRPISTPHIFLVGVDHACQYSTELSRSNLPFSKGGSDKPKYDQSFANFLHELANKLNAAVICEEMSETALLKRGTNPRSIPRTVASEFGCLHAYVDPDDSVRKVIYSDEIFHNIQLADDILQMYGRTFPSDIHYVENGEKITLWPTENEIKQIYRRELYWLQQTIAYADARNIIFICGVNHIDTFSNILIKRGITVSVVTRNFIDKYSVQYANVRVYDPSILGPFDICFKCFAEKNPKYTFCLNCGHHSGTFVVDEEIDNFNCVEHNAKAAVDFCSGCGKPKCEECLSSSKRGFSMSAMSRTQYCKACLNLSDTAHANREYGLVNSKTCIHHSTVSGDYHCSTCDSLLCDACTYYTTNSNKARVVEGPFCLICFRYHTLGKRRQLWTSPALPSFPQL